MGWRDRRSPWVRIHARAVEVGVRVLGCSQVLAPDHRADASSAPAKSTPTRTVGDDSIARSHGWFGSGQDAPRSLASASRTVRVRGTRVDDRRAHAVRRVELMDIERTASDRDQTSSDGDQTSSDQDQTASDRDQTSSELDQRSSDRDQEAADVGLAGGSDSETYRRTTLERAFAANERVEASRRRDDTAQVRFTTATNRDADAAMRDVAADARDEDARERDLADDVGASWHQILLRARHDRQRAAIDRERAADDRAQARADRAIAARERCEHEQDTSETAEPGAPR